MMGRTVRAAALGICLLAVAACSHKDKNAPLAYVPADTPFLVANLKPLDNDTQKALLKRLDSQLPLQVQDMQQAADKLRGEGKTDLANLVGELAHEFNGKTYQQIATEDGFALHGLSALYGVGLSPVLRADLADPAKFQAFVGRLEKAYGHTFATAKLGELSYRHATLGDSGVQLVIAIEHKQVVAGLLPADADDTQLGKVLGTRRPDKSVQDTGKLEKLADQRDYTPYVVGYLDTTRLPALLAGGSDPLLMALSKGQATLPKACRGDLERIASRVPMLSFGYTDLDAHKMSEQFDIDLAPDIIKAFRNVKVPLPGLGADLDAPLDIAFGVPLTDIRNFWTAQAAAVASKPFTCPQLAQLNQGFAKLGQGVQKTAIPPFSDLRGVRLQLRNLSMQDGEGMPHLTGALVLASSNPQGLVAIGQTMLPDLSQIKLEPNGKPVALPGRASALFGQPAWIALNDKAIVLGVGKGEKSRMGKLLTAETGEEGELVKGHIDGDMYVKLLDLIQTHSLKTLEAAETAAKNSSNPDQAAKVAAAATRLKAQMDAVRKQAGTIHSMDTMVHMGEHGLVISGTVHMK